MIEAQERNSELEDVSCHNGEMIKKLQVELNQAKKCNQELRDTIKGSVEELWEFQKAQKKEAGLKDVVNEILNENFPSVEK